MHTAAITYRNGPLQARELDDQRKVRLPHLETRALYLDLALAELLVDVACDCEALGLDASALQCAAEGLLVELADMVELRDAAHSPVAPPALRERRVPRPDLWAKPLVLGFRALIFAAVVATAFMLTTWLNTLR